MWSSRLRSCQAAKDGIEHDIVWMLSSVSSLSGRMVFSMHLESTALTFSSVSCISAHATIRRGIILQVQCGNNWQGDRSMVGTLSLIQQQRLDDAGALYTAKSPKVY